MRALIQRVSEASVSVDGKTIGQCGHGLLILVCAMPGDTPEIVAKLAEKISKLRIFKDSDGRMNCAIRDVGGSALVVSQFTLAADTSRGNRPGFSGAADPETAKQYFGEFVKSFSEQGHDVETGEFGADMQVSLVNDGPVTIWLDTNDWRRK